MAEDTDETRCGYVALIGAPNAGKSTLMNALVGTKLSIVSPKVQTTRMRVLGIQIHESAQIIFVDTPGIFAPKRRLDRAMVDAAWRGAGDADHIALLVDVRQRDTEETEAIVAGLAKSGKRADLILNKIDLIERGKLLSMAERWHKEGLFDEVFMVSALKGDGIDRLMSHFARLMPPGPWLFPEDQLSDIPQRLLAAEITREQLYLQLHDELPYSAAVETEAWEEFDNGSVRIMQTIYVERDSQRAIVLGKGGSRIRSIGTTARGELSRLMERTVHLSLFVKVRERWGDDREHYSTMGLDYDA
jgi:GTP-binding protein Era